MKSSVQAESFDPRTFPLDLRWFERPTSIHGLSYTRRVLIHAHAIAASVCPDPVELEATPAQLLGEYYWVTITRGVVLPPKEQVERWLDWFGK